MSPLLAILIALVGVAVFFFLVVPLLHVIGRLIAHVFRFIGSEISDVLRIFGGVLTSVVFTPLVIFSIVLGRWSAARHYGGAIQDEIGAIGYAFYRIVIGNPARLLGLTALTDGIENRVPEAMAKAPGRDKPKRSTGQFDGYKIVGSIAGGGSGAKLYVAEPDEIKRAALERRGVEVDQVVIKSFSLKEGSSLPQIIREGRALEAAKQIGLVLEHELTDQRFFYVMPYVPGDDLGTVSHRLHEASGPEGLETGRMVESLGYVSDLLNTLERYHRAGLWHKDVKPDNIIVHDGRAHVVDLGLVTPLRSAMTLTTHGTEYFRDPELVRMALKGVKVHEVNGVKFDVYAAGAVLYSMIEDSFPAHGGLSHLTKRCPEAVRWVIRRAMTDYNSRYDSAAMMLADVDAIRTSADPFGMKPADLPSMRGGAPVPVMAEAPEDAPKPEVSRPGLRHAAVMQSAGMALTAENDEWLDSLPRRMRTANWSTPEYPTTRIRPEVVKGLAEEAKSRSDDEIRLAAATVWVSEGNGVNEVKMANRLLDQWRNAPVSYADAAPAQQRQRPNIRQVHWWTGRYKTDGVRAADAGAPAQVGRAEAAHFATPVARTPRVPRDQRAPASEQLRHARERAKAARERARQRVHNRVRNRRYKNNPNKGVFTALFIFLLGIAFVGAIVVVNDDSGHRVGTFGSTTINLGDERVQVSLDDADREELREYILEEFDVDIDELDGKKVHEFATDLENRLGSFFNNVSRHIPGARKGEGGTRAVVSATTGSASALEDHRWLVINDVGEAATESQRDAVTALFDAMASAGCSVVGAYDGSSEAIELIASARAALGTLQPGDPATTRAMKNWLADQQDAFSGVLWLPAPTSSRVDPQLFALDASHARDLSRVIESIR